ncbi:baseplate J/gp47 family protein [Pseudomonas oryzihabitans]|uniref:baseplate assembly protein n=1 Tax=Pseudomonas oryzihabitans TaxID=47885 RepID=UPI002895F72C|nr:baseplate J/gp47 family protein [Pseudomonas oryzihabitans]MDT3721409.1 baseplate J/gp47 family protein [Pseudomonas oryzihabitans]
MIDLSQLPPPTVVETLDYETLLAQRKARLLALWPAAEQAALADRLALESEPLTKLLEENTYRELLLRQRINEGAKATLLAYAIGADLENLAAWYGVTRALVTPADPDAKPPRAAVYESDERLRQRTQLALEGFTTAGSRNAYRYHALSASPQVKDVAILRPLQGMVRVVVLAAAGDGAPDAALLAQVAAALDDEDVRPLCDTVEVSAAAVLSYQVKATLQLYPGPELTVVRQNALAKAEAYVTERHALGKDVTRSGLFAALHQSGVHNVRLVSPASDLAVTAEQAAYCSAISLTTEVADDA